MNHRKRSGYTVGDPPTIENEASFLYGRAVYGPSIPISPPGSPFFIENIETDSLDTLHSWCDTTLVVDLDLPHRAPSGYCVTSGPVVPTAVSGYIPYQNGWDFYDYSKLPIKTFYQFRKELPNGRYHEITHEEHDKKEGPHAKIKIMLKEKTTREELKRKSKLLKKKVDEILEIFEEDDEEAN